MANKVTCTVNNQLGNGLNLLGYEPEGSTSHYGSGQWVTPPENLLATGTSTTAFVIEEKNGMNGSMGNVRYDLGNNLGQLVLMFRCNDSTRDYFYGLIQGYDQQQLSAPCNIKAFVQGWFSNDPCDPEEPSSMSITVTVSYT